jgi:autotransporter-associated beta strand protein
LQVTGTLSNSTNVINSGIYDVDTTDTINSLSGTGAVQIASGVTLTTGDTEDYTISGIISGDGNLTKAGSGSLTLSNNSNSYTGDTTVSEGTLTLTGNLSSSTDLIISPGATLDLQATQTVTSLDLDGTISNSAGSSALTVSGTSAIGGNITTDGNQIYTGAITLTGDSILTSSSGAITLSSTVNGGSSLTTSSSSNFIASGVIGGDNPLSSLSVTAGDNAQYFGNITTTGAITFNAVGNVDAGGTITLRTTNSNVTLNADSDGDGTGTFYGGTITINSGSGNVIIRGSTIANEGYSVVGTGTLTIESNAASFGDTFTSSYLSEAATLTGLTIGKSTNTSTVTMNSAISIAGAVTIYGNDINLNQAITGSGNITITAAQDIWMNTGFTQIYSTGSGNFIKLLAKRNISNIINAPSITLTTTGGDILVASDTDNSGGGFITIVTGSTFESNGGDITIAGGSTTGSGYAKGYSGTAWYGEGLRLDGNVNIASSNGNIILRGEAYNGSITDGQGAAGISFYGAEIGTQTVDINSGTGTILIDAKGYSYTSSYSAALNFGLANSGDNDTTTIQSANTTSSAITINANHYTNGANGFAIRNWYKPLHILATANGGGITINTSNARSIQDYEIYSLSEIQILAKTGDIQVLGGGTNQLFYTNAAFYLGSVSGVNGGTSSSNIIFQSDDFLIGSGSFRFATTGTVTIRSVNNSFTDTQSLSSFTLNDNSKTMSGFTFGKSTNTSDITLNSNITSSGAVTVYGSTINLFSNINSSGAGDITISASTKIEDNTTEDL